METAAAPSSRLAFASRFAWPAAFVAVAAMTFAYLREAQAPPAPQIQVSHPGATVVRDLRALSRLETASLRVEKVVEVKDHQTHLHGLVDADDTLLFVAAGEVVLGVDLAKIRDEDVRIDPNDGVVHVALPLPEVFSTRFDEPRSYVHARSTDLLAKRNEGLEAAARREAQAAFAEAGRDARAIDRAKEQAEKQLSALARAWGTKGLVVTWKGPQGEIGLAAP